MKKIAFISASALLCTTVLVSCTSNKMAVNSFEDNLYFMSADVKKATENAVANNQPATFQNLASSTVVPQENFSPFPSDNLASAAAVISDANCSICSLLSSLEWLSALFHMPGQCTIFILYWERKSLMRITALFTELCIQRKFK